MALTAAPIAEGQTAAQRPRVGLALGGGSARGIAHVGVLRWLEEHRIPVDYVAGTSMGGLVGGGYATGMTPTEIETLLANADWDLIFKTDAPYRLKGFRRKQDALGFPVKLELGLKGGLSLPSGINPGHHIGALLSSIALPYSAIDDFDDLPIPFRCTATDLKHGEAIVLDHGALGVALRATMAIPALFDPVPYEDRLLADGGMLNNVPVDVARAMGADIVIAVKVGRLDPDVPTTFLGLADRALTVMMEVLTEPRLEQADLVVLPNLGEFSASDFRRSAAVIQAGYEAAAAHAGFLLPLALDEEAWQAHLAARRSRMRALPERLDSYEVTGLPEREASRLARTLERRLGGRLDETAIAQNLNRVVGTGRYASATYGLIQRGEKAGLAVAVREKTHAPPFVNFFTDINNEGEDFNFDFAARTTLFDPTTYGSELRVEGGVGSIVGVGAELFQPLGGRGPFGSLHAGEARVSENLFAGEELAAVFRTRRTVAGADLGWLMPSGEVRAGYETAHARVEQRIGLPVFDTRNGQEQLLRATITADTRDAPFFARSGQRVELRSTWYLEVPLTEERFGRLNGSVNIPFPVGRRHRGILQLSGDTVLGPEAPALYSPSLGGPFRLSGFGIDALRGRHAVLGHMVYMHSLAKMPEPLGDRLYALGMVEMGSAFDSLDEARLKFSGTTGLAFDSFFGPAFVGASVGNEGTLRFLFTLGKLVR